MAVLFLCSCSNNSKISRAVEVELRMKYNRGFTIQSIWERDVASQFFDFVAYPPGVPQILFSGSYDSLEQKIIWDSYWERNFSYETVEEIEDNLGHLFGLHYVYGCLEGINPEDGTIAGMTAQEYYESHQNDIKFHVYIFVDETKDNSEVIENISNALKKIENKEIICDIVFIDNFKMKEIRNFFKRNVYIGKTVEKIIEEAPKNNIIIKNGVIISEN